MLFSMTVFGQWSGSSLNGNTYRNGNVGIAESNPSALLHIKSIPTGPRLNVDGTISPGITPINLRLQRFASDMNTNYYWDVNAGSSLDFSYGTSISNMVSTMNISTTRLEFRGRDLRIGTGEERYNLGIATSPAGHTGQYLAFGADNIGGANGWSFTGNSTNNGGAIIHGDNKGNLFFITRSTASSNNMNSSQTAANIKMRIHENGKVSIGTSSTDTDTNVDGDDYLLFVKGGTLSEEVTVRAGWADYVFDTDYDLLPLEAVETHIEENGHLHNTPSATDLDGKVNLGDATVNQQEKIEEIYLHLIELNKEIKALKAENQQLKQKIEQLEK